jgi:DNA-binding response OmpR family regulator
MRIIIIDDDYHTCQTLAHFLEGRGFTTRSHTTIADGVRTLITEEWDLMLLDYHLPGLNGTDALPIIQEVSPTLPVILMIDEANRQDQARALKAGAFCLLQKPINRRELLRVIRSTHLVQRTPKQGKK